ncbi:MAG: hypothetical protein JST23_07120 [Bacteroidetes bacterium]|nr:hypothetical protein [Bacteroidota bacterium]
MNKIFCSIVLILLIKSESIYSRNTYTSNNKKIDTSAVLDTSWIQYDVYENNQKGMMFHFTFTTYGLKGVNTYVSIYFYDADTDEPLEDKNGKYVSKEGYVSAFKEIKPNYDPAVYKDFKIFMPYSEFHLDSGYQSILYDAVINDNSGKIALLLATDIFDIELNNTQPLSENNNAKVKTINIIFKELSVNYDVKRGDKTGMDIHLNFSTEYLKDSDAFAIVYFFYKDNRKILNKNPDFSSKDGQLITYKKIKPSYDFTDYKNLVLFMPYDEIPGTGKIDMKMVAKIIKPDGTVLKYLTEKSFIFTR